MTQVFWAQGLGDPRAPAPSDSLMVDGQQHVCEK